MEKKPDSKDKREQRPQEIKESVLLYPIPKDQVMVA